MLDSSHVVLQTIHHVPLDVASAIAYIIVFAAFALVTWRRPLYALVGFILLEPFALYRYIDATTITLPKTAVIAIVLGLLLRRPNWRTVLDRNSLPILVGAGLTIAATALSYLQAEYKVPVLRETLKAFEYLVIYVLAVFCYRSEPDETLIRRALFAIAALVSILALTQEFTAAPAGIWIGHHAVPRIAGPLEGPNQLSAYLGLLLPMLVAFMLRRGGRPLEWIALALALGAELLTFSRAGVAATVVAVVAVFAFGGGRLAVRYALGFLVLAAAGLAATLIVGGNLTHFFSTKSQLQPEGLGTRGELWTAAYRLWRAHPLLGIGAGNYELELGRVGYPSLHTHSNSGYIQALVEGGFPQLLALLWVTWLSIATFVRARVREPLVLGVIGASIGLALHQVLDLLTFYPKVGMLFWILLGVGVASLTVYEDARERPEANANIR